MSELIAGNVGSFAYDETIPFATIASGGAMAATNDLVLLELPRRNDSLLIAKIRVYVTVQTGNLDVGLWSFDGTTWTLITSSGSTAVGVINAVQSVALLAPYQRPARVRTFAGIATDAAGAFGRDVLANAAIGLADFSCVSKGTSFPLATNAASFTTAAVAGNVRAFWLRGVSS